ncbi:hypothetical protein D3C73_773760 [compost metagenome]
MLLHRACIHPVAKLHGQGEHIDIIRQRRQHEVVIEQLVHQLAQFEVVLAVSLSDFGQAVLGEDQLARGGVLCVDVQHALFHQARQVAPAAEGVMIDGCLQARAEGRMDVGGQGFEQRRDAGEKVVDRGGRDLRTLGDTVDRQTGHALGRQQCAGRIEYRIDPRLAACAGFAGGGYACH